MTLSIGSSRSSSGSPEPRRQQPPSNPTAAPSGGRDDEASVLQELEAALAANPALRAATPRPKGEEWEDFDKLMAENPDFAKPVAGREKKFYMSKDKWDCGHEGEPTMTNIERDGDDQASILTNDVRGICPTCMAKWTKLESHDEEATVGQGASSRDPFNTGGPPAYEPANDNDNDSDSGSDRIFWRGKPDTRHKYLEEWDEIVKDNYGHADETSGKGKEPAHPYGKESGNDWMFDKGGDSDSDSVYEEKRTK